MFQIMIINGPNLNMLGVREPEIYGDNGFDEYLQALQKEFEGIADITYRQSNVEGELINYLQDAHKEGYDGVVLNAGGYTHTSVAIRDAIAAIRPPVVEVHISNIYAREEFRRNSLLSPVCHGVVCGMGLEGYRYAILSFTDQLLSRHLCNR